VDHVQRQMTVSQRRACKTLGQPRATQRAVRTRPDRDKPLVSKLHQLSRRYPRYGYRMIAALVRQEGWFVNRKRIYRLWRQEGLQVPRRSHKRPRCGDAINGCTRKKARYPNHVWTYDFLYDQTADGRRLKLLPVVDEFTRECLTLEVTRRMEAQDVIGVLEYLFALRGAPRYLRSDNGPEFVAQRIKVWLAQRQTGPLFIEPGSPWENAYIESFNSRLRNEFLNVEVFGSLKEAQVLAEQHRLEYNHRRPHSALGYRTPAAFAATCIPPASATPSPPEYTSRDVVNSLMTSGT
jgi:putative transposase